MQLEHVLEQLKSFGTAQNRKVYARHGVRREMYGVSYGNLAKLERQLGTDHELGVALWQTGNHDAMVLAARVIDPEQVRSGQLDQWMREPENHGLASVLAGLAARTRFARPKAEKWRRSRQEHTSQAGWNVTTALVEQGALTNAECLPLIATIECDLQSSPNRTRYAMNNTLIAIGSRGGTLQRRATAAAKRIGKVEVDHGETSCKTPDAASYIAKTVEHRKQLAERRAQRARDKAMAKKAGGKTGAKIAVRSRANAS